MLEIRKIPQNIKLALVNRFNYNYLFVFGWVGFIKYRLKKKTEVGLKYKYFKIDGSKRYFFLYRKLINNFFSWSNKIHKKNLKLQGVGFKFKIFKNSLFLVIGYSHILKINFCNNIKIKLLKNKHLELYSIDLFLLNRYIYLIKKLKLLDVYKGKGILLGKEKIIKKEGKKSTF